MELESFSFGFHGASSATRDKTVSFLGGLESENECDEMAVDQEMWSDGDEGMSMRDEVEAKARSRVREAVIRDSNGSGTRETPDVKMVRQFRERMLEAMRAMETNCNTKERRRLERARRLAVSGVYDKAEYQTLVLPTGPSVKREVVAVRKVVDKGVKGAVSGAKERAKKLQTQFRKESKEEIMRVKMMARAHNAEVEKRRKIDAKSRAKRAKKREEARREAMEEEAITGTLSSASRQRHSGASVPNKSPRHRSEYDEFVPSSEGEEDEDEDETIEHMRAPLSDDEEEEDEDYLGSASGELCRTSFAASKEHLTEEEIQDTECEQLAGLEDVFNRRAAGGQKLHTDLMKVKRDFDTHVLRIMDRISSPQNTPSAEANARNGGPSFWNTSRPKRVVCRGVTTIIPFVIFGDDPNRRMLDEEELQEAIVRRKKRGIIAEAGTPPYARTGRRSGVGVSQNVKACCSSVKTTQKNKRPASCDGTNNSVSHEAREHGTRAHAGLELLIDTVTSRERYLHMTSVNGPSSVFRAGTTLDDAPSVFGDCAPLAFSALLSKGILPIASEVPLRAAYGGLLAIVDAIGVMSLDGPHKGSPVFIEFKTGSTGTFDVPLPCDPYVMFRINVLNRKESFVLLPDTPLLRAKTQIWAALCIARFAFGIEGCLGRVVHVASRSAHARVYDLEPFMYQDLASRLFYTRIIEGHLSPQMMSILGFARRSEASDKRFRYDKFREGRKSKKSRK